MKIIIKRIKQFYLQSSTDYEYAKHFSKSPYSYDTIANYYYKIKNYKNELKNYVTGVFDANYSLTHISGFDGGKFTIHEKYKTDAKKISDKIKIPSIFSFPSENFEQLEQVYGTFDEIKYENNSWVIVTKKVLLIVEPQTFEISEVYIPVKYQDRNGFDLFLFSTLEDSLQKNFTYKILNSIDSSKYIGEYSNYFKESDLKVLKHEKEKFLFDSLLNKISTKNNIPNKYVILDFFFLSCLPCYQMHEFMKDWIKNVDTSKLTIIGINTVDADYTIAKFISDKKINYPIISTENAKKIADTYNIYLYPTFFLISPTGIIEKIQIGKSETFFKEAKKIILNKKNKL